MLSNLNQDIKFNAVAGVADAKASDILWAGRQVGKTPRKDIALSAAIKPATAATVATLDAEKLAMLLTDSSEAYIRRVKLQRLEIGGSCELSFSYETMLNMLTAPAERTKRLVSTASIRALMQDAMYKTAVSAVIAAEKLETWNRLSREFFPIITASEAVISDSRSSARDAVVVRGMEIAVAMPSGSESRTLLEAALSILAEIPTSELSDSI